MKLSIYSLTWMFFLGLTACTQGPDRVDWPAYGGGKDNNQYANIDQINRENVKQLQVVWTYSSGDKDLENRSQIQCNPLIVNGVLYGSSAQLKFFALQADTGTPIWEFDPFDGAYDQFGAGVNRGLVYWGHGREARILFTAGSNLYALDAATGRLIAEFGQGGKVDLHAGLGERAKDLFVISNTPGVIFEDLLILGTRVSEGPNAAPGYVRAYDVRSGAIRWTFHTIPQPGEFGYETWPADAWERIGGANAWAGLSLDEARGMVFVPTGSASFDFYGGDRLGQNLFANCVLALDARTGERIWHYQTVHHDLWDRDLPAAPNLLTITHEGVSRDVVAQITKSAWVFVLDRDTGRPIFPVEERPVPASDLVGEFAWPTQPFPVKPPPFGRQRFEANMMNSLSDSLKARFAKRFESIRHSHIFEPPSEQGSLIFPGFDGGGEWGGAAADPQRGWLYVNASEMPWILTMSRLVPERPGDQFAQGRNLYLRNCAACHGADRKGNSFMGEIPSLEGLQLRMRKKAFAQVLQTGQGSMPPFAYFNPEQVEALTQYLFGKRSRADSQTAQPDTALSPPHYIVSGFERFQEERGYPAIEAPWGTLTAIDLNVGVIKWQVPLGEFAELSTQGIPLTGTENYGGPLLTAGGLVFVAASRDGRIRAFDQDTGEMHWQADLPAGGYATPSTYMVKGKQYVVIACGGGKMGTPSGDAYVAFALPD